MKTEELIASGLLEAYVLDQLSTAERLEVEDSIEQSPEVRKELALIELSLENLSKATAVVPPPEIKAKLLDEVEVKEVDLMFSRRFTFYQYLSAAAVGLLLITTGLTFLFWSKWQTTEEQLTDLISENQRIADRYNVSNEELIDAKNQLAFVQLPEVQKIELEGTANAPSASSIVYWNGLTDEVYLSAGQLQELPEDLQYQLWAIIDGKPVDAGLVAQARDKALLKMKSINGEVAAFAITIEPKGGSENPTLEKMQVLGNV